MPILSAMEFQVVVKNGSHILNPRHTKVAGLIKKLVKMWRTPLQQCFSAFRCVLTCHREKAVHIAANLTRVGAYLISIGCRELAPTAASNGYLRAAAIRKTGNC